MFRPIVSSEAPMLLVGGGQSTVSEVSEVLTGPLAPEHLVAADSGAKVALAAGRVPDAIIGDFDSLDAASRASLPPQRLHHVPDQDSTDFEKCLARVEAPLIIGLGFLGGRLDHQLAALSALLKDPRPIVLLGGGELCFVSPPRLDLDLADATPIGLYPLVAGKLTSRGLLYPLDAAQVAPDGLISTSNRVAGGPVQLRPSFHGLLVTLPRSALAVVSAALLGAPRQP